MTWSAVLFVVVVALYAALVALVIGRSTPPRRQLPELPPAKARRRRR